MLVEIALMPIDIARTYLEIQRLRKAVQEAELALKASFARSPHRPRDTGRMNARGLQPINPKIPVLKQSRN